MKKADFFIIAIAILSAAALAAIFAFARSGGDVLTAEIYVGSELRQTYDLTKIPPGTTESVTVGSGEGYNTLELSHDGVSVTDADCGGRDCVHMGIISRPGEIIACLPHRMYIKLTGSAPGERAVDIVAG